MFLILLIFSIIVVFAFVFLFYQIKLLNDDIECLYDRYSKIIEEEVFRRKKNV